MTTLKRIAVAVVMALGLVIGASGVALADPYYPGPGPSPSDGDGPAFGYPGDPQGPTSYYSPPYYPQYPYDNGYYNQPQFCFSMNGFFISFSVCN